jgi:hypothetical protein
LPNGKKPATDYTDYAAWEWNRMFFNLRNPRNPRLNSHYEFPLGKVPPLVIAVEKSSLRNMARRTFQPFESPRFDSEAVRVLKLQLYWN